MVEIGDKSWIVQKMGGEDILFQRDKRKRHFGSRYLRQQGERDFIGGINDVMKTKIMDESCLGVVDDLYHLYYFREHCANTGANFRAMVASLSGGAAAGPVADALAYAEREMEKVQRRRQDKEHGFLQYKLMEQRLRPLRADPRFIRLLGSAGLPEHKILRDHIAQILAFRELERGPSLQRRDTVADESALAARDALLEDNLDTIIFFRLAERMVGHAFANVISARERNLGDGGNRHAAILRDTRNSSFLLADTVARLLYRYVVSHEQKDDFHEAMGRRRLDDVFLANMTAYVAKGLAFSGYKTREFWELEGGPDTEGYVELFLEHPIPPEAVEEVVRRRPEYGDAIAEISGLLGHPAPEPLVG